MQRADRQKQDAIGRALSGNPDFRNPIHPIRWSKHAYKWATSPVKDDDPGIGATWPKRRK